MSSYRVLFYSNINCIIPPWLLMKLPWSGARVLLKRCRLLYFNLLLFLFDFCFGSDSFFFLTLFALRVLLAFWLLKEFWFMFFCWFALFWFFGCGWLTFYAFGWMLVVEVTDFPERNAARIFEWFKNGFGILILSNQVLEVMCSDACALMEWNNLFKIV